MRYTTRGGSNPQGKAKVYFCAADGDFEMLAPLAEELLACRNCAVWYLSPEETLEETSHKEALAEMQLFLIPVTRRLLTEPSRAKTLEIPFAMEHHIPVLPLMQEEGLLSLYPSLFGEIQYLSKLESDETGLSYEEKYKRYIDSVLVGGALATRVRAAFDSYIFLSYRKKDRRHADALMRLIHGSDALSSVAIWYDEFLVPGENFNDAITEALDKCAAVALVVTPNLVCEENYVAGVEYPLAKKKGKPVLPVEFVPTDRGALSRDFEGIAEPAVAEEKTVGRLFASLVKRVVPHKKTAEHDYLMGLAYLGAIDVERDYDRAHLLLLSAAEKGSDDAMEKLYAMHQNGEGVARDPILAAHWLSRKAEFYLKKFKKSRTAADASVTARAYFRLAEHYRGLGQTDRSAPGYTSAYDYASIAATLTGDGTEERHFVAVCERSLAAIAATEARYATACDYYRHAAEVFASEWERDGSAEALSELTDCRLALADCALAVNDADGAHSYLEQAREGLFPHKAESALRRIYIAVLGKLGEFFLGEGENVRAEKYLSEHYALCRERHEELKNAATRAALVEATVLLARAYGGLGDEARAERYAEEALLMAREDAERDVIPATLRRLEKTLSARYEAFHDRYEWESARELAEERLEVLRELAGQNYTRETVLSICSVYAQLSRVYFSQGRPEDARPFVEAGINLIHSRGLSDTMDPAVFTVRTACYEALGGLHRREGRLSEARRVFEEQLEERERFLAIRENPLALGMVYKICNELSWIIGNDVQARRRYSERMLACALAWHEKEKCYASSDGVWYGTQRVAMAHMYAADYEKAKALFEEALALAEELYRVYPVPSAKCTISITACSLCDLYVKLKNADEAERYNSYARRISEELVEERGSYSDRRNLYLAYERVRTIAAMREDKEGTFTADRMALEAAAEVGEAYPCYESYRDVLRCAKKLHESAKALSDEEAHEFALQKWVEGAVGMQEIHPDEDTQLNIVLSADRLGDVCEARGDITEALESYELALTHAEALAKEHGGVTYFRNAAIMYRKIGKQHAKGDNHFGAKNCFKAELDYRLRVSALSDTEADKNDLEAAEKRFAEEEEKLFTLYGIPKTPPVEERAELPDEPKAEKETPPKRSFFSKLFHKTKKD